MITYRVRITKPPVYTSAGRLVSGVDINRPTSQILPSELLDITDYVQKMDWRIGSRANNNLGNMMKSGTGSVTCFADDPDFKMFLADHHKDFDPLPGARVLIDVFDGTERVTGFVSWTQDIPQITHSGQGQILATIPLRGALAQLGISNNNIFTIPPAELSHELIEGLLNNAAWPQDARSIGDGVARLDKVRVAASGILEGPSRTSASLTTALAAVTQAEIGRLYDDFQGRIVFEGRTKRSIDISRLQDNFFYDDGAYYIDGRRDALIAGQVSVTSGIINSIKADDTKYETIGRDDTGINFARISSYPHSLNFSSELITRIELPLDLTLGVATRLDKLANPQLVASKVSFQDLQGNTLEGVEATVEESYTGGITLVIANTSGKRGRVTLQERFVLADRWRRGGTNFFTSLIKPHQGSIDRFGRREMVYPASLVDLNNQLAKDLNWITNTHHGFDLRTLYRIDGYMSAIKTPDILRAKIGDIFTLQHILGHRGTTFFADEIKHDVKLETGEHTVLVRLSASSGFTFARAGISRVGIDNRVAPR